MSLLVNNYTRSTDGKIQVIEPAEHWEELAGFESYRHKLYGSAAARSLGLTLLPTLTSGDLYVEGNDVVHLRTEAELALANIELFETESGSTAEHLRSRFENIINACLRASVINGGVVIW